MGECPERQRGRTVNPLAYAFVGSSPTSPTSSHRLENQRESSVSATSRRPISCRVMLPFVRVCFPLFSGIPEIAASPCDMDATQAHSAKVTWRAAMIFVVSAAAGHSTQAPDRHLKPAALGNGNPASVSGPFLLSAD